MRKKRSISLIEVLISLGLLSFLLSTFFYFYGFFFRNKHEFSKDKEMVYERKYGLVQLENILSHATHPFLSEDGKSLIFFFERGIFEDPLLSGTVLAKLYYDETIKSLCLSIWPKPEKEHPQKDPHQNVVIFENIEQPLFSFYHPPSVTSNQVNPEKIDRDSPKTGWQDNWKSSYNTLPALIKMDALWNQDKLIAIIDMQQPICYPKEKIST